MENKNFKVALIGYGFSGKNIHSNLIMNTPGLDLELICDSVIQKSEKYPSVQFTTQVDDIFNNAAIDLVVVATPNASHFALAKAALLAGKNVIVDKPLTITLAEATELVEVAKKQNKLLCTFQNRRFDSDFLTVQKVLAEGAIGQLRYFESNYTFFFPDVGDGWREKTGQAGTGVWYDLGAHVIDQMVLQFGEPLDGYVNFACQRENAGCPDFFKALYIYPDFRVGLQGNLLCPAKSPRFHLNGTKGSYVKHGVEQQESRLIAGVVPGSKDWGKDPNDGVLTTYENGQLTENIYPSVDGNYLEYYRQLREALKGNQQPPVSFEQMLATTRVIENTKRIG